jgi:hypothetical protein
MNIISYDQSVWALLFLQMGSIFELYWMYRKVTCIFLAKLWDFVINNENIYIGIDPQWSVRLAFKWCENPEWIHVNTTPLFSLVRDCGSMFGLAMVAPVASR